MDKIIRYLKVERDSFGFSFVRQSYTFDDFFFKYKYIIDAKVNGFTSRSTSDYSYNLNENNSINAIKLSKKIIKELI